MRLHSVVGTILFLLVGTSFTQDTAGSASPAGSLWSQDVAIVRAILDSNGMRETATADVCAQEDGRLVTLNLTNKQVGATGLTRLLPAIGKLSSLRELRLANNSLAALPDEIGNLAELRILDLGSNQVAILPATIAGLANLEKLDIRYNGIEQFPAAIVSLKKLWYLQLWGNHLLALPESIGEMAALKELYLKDNRLDMLPHAITKMKSLTYIDYNYNRICKPTPDVDAWLKAKDKTYLETQKCW